MRDELRAEAERARREAEKLDRRGFFGFAAFVAGATETALRVAEDAT